MPLKTRLCLLIFFLALLLYGNTLFNGYTRDDFTLITNNEQVKRGVAAIGDIFSSKLRDGTSAIVKNELYRPLTKLVYALEWDLGGDNPFTGHLFNVLLFALLSVLFFLVMLNVFHANAIAACLSTLVFVAHPIHTEVVASIKSVDEILALLFFLACLLQLSAYLRKSRVLHLIYALLLFTLGLFSKESAITFILLIPLYLYYVHPVRVSTIVRCSSFFLVPLLLFLAIRSQVMGNYDHAKMIARIDNFLVMAGPGQKLATSLYMLGTYIKLLFIPYPLVSDYSFHHFPFVTFTNAYALLSVLIIALLLFYALKKVRSKDRIAFSILWFFITIGLASNLFYLIGTNFAERLLFAPSIGFCVFLPGFLLSLKKGEANLPASFSELLRQHPWNSIALSLILLVFAGLTINRNADWKSDLTLVTADVRQHPNSARLHVSMADELRNSIVISRNASEVQKQNLPLIKYHLEEAIRIFPDYGTAHFSLGEYYMHIDSMRLALAEFNQAQHSLARSPKLYNALGMCLYRLKQYDAMRQAVTTGLQLDPQNTDLITKYGAVMLTENKPDSAIYFLDQSLLKNAQNSFIYELLAAAYAAKHDSLQSRHYKQLEAKYKF